MEDDRKHNFQKSTLIGCDIIVNLVSNINHNDTDTDTDIISAEFIWFSSSGGKFVLPVMTSKSKEYKLELWFCFYLSSTQYE
jgi:hypothetical protein